MYLLVIVAPPRMQVKVARPVFVPTWTLARSVGSPVRTSKLQVPAVRSISGQSQASLPFLVESQYVLISGTCAPFAAGSGLATVRAQIHAITLASPPIFYLCICCF